MARFRARRKKALEEAAALRVINIGNPSPKPKSPVLLETNSASSTSQNDEECSSKYAKLLEVIEKMGKEVRLSYTGSKSSAERLKSGIVKAKNLIKDCLIETRINFAQS